MYNENNYSRSESIFDRLPKTEDGNLARYEGLFRNLPGSENPSSSTYYEYHDRTRPTSITVVAVLLLIGLAFGLFQVLSLLNYIDLLPGWVWLVLLVDYSLLISAIIGLFQMKKYGAWTLLAQSVISTVSSLALGATTIGLINLVCSVIMLFFVFRKYADMQ